MLPDTIAHIVLEILKMINWRLVNLPAADAAKAASQLEADLNFWRQWMPKPPKPEDV